MPGAVQCLAALFQKQKSSIEGSRLAASGSVSRFVMEHGTRSLLYVRESMSSNEGTTEDIVCADRLNLDPSSLNFPPSALKGV